MSPENTPYPDPLILLGQATSALKLETLPPDVLRCARQRVLDTLGCLIAGYSGGISDAVRDYVLAQGGRPEATLLPGGQKTTAGLAGLAHASYIFGLELADAAPRGTVHPGCEIVSIALSVAERDGLSGAALLPAIVAGYEAEIRFGRAVHPHAFYRGWSTIGLFGAIGPAATCGHLLKQDAAAMRRTLGTVLSLLPAATGRVSQGGSVKWLVGGHAAATGLLAAEMANRGTYGHNDAVKIFLPVISDQNSPERLTEGITSDGVFTQWELTSGVLTKYYATVGPIAAPLDAAFALIKEHDIRAEDITEIHADCTRRTAIFNNPQPETDHTARASLPYCMAVAVCTRDSALLLGPAYQPHMLANPEFQAMAQRVRITQNDDYEGQYPARSLCRITIKLRNGVTHDLEVDRTANPRYLKPSDADIEDKFRLIATPVLGKRGADHVVALVSRIESLPNVRELVDALRPG